MRVDNLVARGLTTTALNTAGTWILVVCLTVVVKLGAGLALDRLTETSVNVSRGAAREVVCGGLLGVCGTVGSYTLVVVLRLEGPVVLSAMFFVSPHELSYLDAGAVPAGRVWAWNSGTASLPTIAQVRNWSRQKEVEAEAYQVYQAGVRWFRGRHAPDQVP